jgi:DNA polymerase I-like protein with 3'-5' exonuclease and polymerase domains
MTDVASDAITPPCAKTPRSSKLDPEEKERRRLARAEVTRLAKIERDREKVLAKVAAKQAKITAAEGGLVELPAAVIRQASGLPTVVHVSDSEAWKVLEHYLEAMCLDCETSGYPLGHLNYELKTIQLGGEEAAIVFDASDPRQLDIASLALQLAKKLHAHSAVADIVPVVHAGLIEWDAAWAKMHDSVLYAKLTDPHMSGSDAEKLKELAHDLLRDYAVSPTAEKAKNELFKAMGCLMNVDITTPIARNGWARVNRNSVVMTRYAGSDVLDLAAVMRVLPPLPVHQDVLTRERHFEAICARITWKGFKLDVNHIKGMIAEYEEKKKEALGLVQYLSCGKIENPSSDKVAGVLMEMYPGIPLGLTKLTATGGGNPSADKKSLKAVLAQTDDFVLKNLLEQILEYRHDTTTLSLLLRPLESLCDFGDGRMRPTVYTINADTGRTSCVRPNGQQFSREGGIRACVHCDPGYLGVDADFQGCEIRVGAALSGDRQLLEAELSLKCHACGFDPCVCGKQHVGLHWLAAHLTFGPGATKANRYTCKAVIFRKMFGGKPETAVAIEIDRIFDEQIAPTYAAWDKWLRDSYYKGYMCWRDYSTGENMRQKLDGKKRGIYRTYNGRLIYINAPHAFGNYAIQGTARELLVDAVIKWDAGPWREETIFPIHDEAFTWTEADDAEAARAYLVQCMETDILSTPDFRVHIGADPAELFEAWPDSA